MSKSLRWYCKPLYVQKLREGAPIGSFAGGWRSGKRLVTTHDGSLPKRCIKCNEPTDSPQLKRKLSWHSPVLYVVILADWSSHVIVALCMPGARRLWLFENVSSSSTGLPQKPSCNRHCTADDPGRGKAAFVAGINMEGDLMRLTFYRTMLAGVVLFFIGLVYGIIRGRYIYPTKIDKQHAWLGGCGAEFLAGFPEWNG